MLASKLLLAMAAGFAAAALTKEQELLFFNAVKKEGVDVHNIKPVASVELNTWVPPETAAPYLYWLAKAEIEYGLPENLLVRVAYQESRFRSEIISGEKVSRANAQGIMQIVPKWHPDVNPLNPEEAIDYAGQYLAKLKKAVGSWRLALAAYNWGIGNLRNKGIDAAPKETRDYMAQISNDVLKGIA